LYRLEENRMKNDIFRRRGLLKGGLTVFAGALLASTAARADDDKVDPSTVQYQKTPNNGQQCSGCVNFVAPNACKVVSGVIVPTGWCVAFAPKA
jgi:hypothetical protein